MEPKCLFTSYTSPWVKHESRNHFNGKLRFKLHGRPELQPLDLKGLLSLLEGRQPELCNPRIHP